MNLLFDFRVETSDGLTASIVDDTTYGNGTTLPTSSQVSALFRVFYRDSSGTIEIPVTNNTFEMKGTGRYYIKAAVSAIAPWVFDTIYVSYGYDINVETLQAGTVTSFIATVFPHVKDGDLEFDKDYSYVFTGQGSNWIVAADFEHYETTLDGYTFNGNLLDPQFTEDAGPGVQQLTVLTIANNESNGDGVIFSPIESESDLLVPNVSVCVLEDKIYFTDETEYGNGFTVPSRGQSLVDFQVFHVTSVDQSEFPLLYNNVTVKNVSVPYLLNGRYRLVLTIKNNSSESFGQSYEFKKTFEFLIANKLRDCIAAYLCTYEEMTCGKKACSITDNPPSYYLERTSLITNYLELGTRYWEACEFEKASRAIENAEEACANDQTVEVNLSTITLHTIATSNDTGNKVVYPADGSQPYFGQPKSVNDVVHYYLFETNQGVVEKYYFEGTYNGGDVNTDSNYTTIRKIRIV